MTDKLDLSKLWKDDYVAPRKPVVLDIGQASYLAVEGQGEPGGDCFSTSVGALYAIAYTIKMTRKFDGRTDYSVWKLEAQWWGKDGSASFGHLPKPQWCWRLMIRTPECVAVEELETARAVLRKRGKDAGTEAVHFHSLVEGNCVQMLHVGPYEDEGLTWEKMAAFAGTRGFVPSGLHHEIYVSDPRRVPAERLKTILRQPLAKPPGGVATKRG